MTRVVVTEKALREMLRETMWNDELSSWSSNEGGPVTVNSNVDPSVAVTDPVNPNFKPQDKTEFGIAIGQLVRNLPDTQMPGLYDTIRMSIEDEAKKEDEAKMKTKSMQGGTKQVEEAFRTVVRNIIADINPKKPVNEAQGDGKGPSPFADRKPWPKRLKKGEVPGPVMNLDNLPPVRKIPAGVHGGEYNARIEKNKADLGRNMGKAIKAYENPPADEVEPGYVDDAGVEAPEEESPALGPAAKQTRKAYKSTAIGGMSDVDGATFDDIAKELGFSIAGAKQAVDKALDKAKFLAQDMDEEDLDILVLTAMNDYITLLSKSGVQSSDKLSDPDDDSPLTSADIQLMKDHPDIIRGLDGFRDFLHNHIRKARKEDQKLLNPLADDGDDEGPTNLEPEAEPELADDAAPRAAAPPPAAAAKAGGKASYKIYPGSQKYAGPDGVKPSAVTRVKGKVYRAGPDTQFSPNEQGEASIDGDKLKVKKVGSDHTQTWDPVEEGKRPVLYLVPRNRR